VSHALPCWPRRFLAAAILLALLGVTGCGEHGSVTAPRPNPRGGAPAPNSPENAIRLFEWGWDHRDTLAVAEVLAGDFRFFFALGDSAGNVFRGDPVDRETMLRMDYHLFIGGGNAAPAKSIALQFDPKLIPQDDGRPGKDPRWHKEILTGVNLSIRTDDNSWNVQGNARFFVVRGDSALIPQDLVAKGLGPDSTRWYIDRWDDETLSGPGARVVPAQPLPTRVVTWGDILALYR